jgi:hypothetical protein
MEVTDSKSRKTTVHARGCDGLSRLFPQQVRNQQATKYELSGSRVKQCCRDAFRLSSPVEEDVMNKSLRLKTKNVEARPNAGKFMPFLTDLASSQHTEKYSVEQQAATAFLSNIDVVAK